MLNEIVNAVFIGRSSYSLFQGQQQTTVICALPTYEEQLGYIGRLQRTYGGSLLPQAGKIRLCMDVTSHARVASNVQRG